MTRRAPRMGTVGSTTVASTPPSKGIQANAVSKKSPVIAGIGMQVTVLSPAPMGRLVVV